MSSAICYNCWEMEELLVTCNFSIFPQCFLPFWRIFCHLYKTWNCGLQTLPMWKSLKFVVWERVKLGYAWNRNKNSFLLNPFIDISLNSELKHFWRRRLLKTMLEKEKGICSPILKMFSTLLKTKILCRATFVCCIAATALNLVESKIFLCYSLPFTTQSQLFLVMNYLFSKFF